jgi:hypothetical protein
MDLKYKVRIWLVLYGIFSNKQCKKIPGQSRCKYVARAYELKCILRISRSRHRTCISAQLGQRRSLSINQAAVFNVVFANLICRRMRAPCSFFQRVRVRDLPTRRERKKARAMPQHITHQLVVASAAAGAK